MSVAATPARAEITVIIPVVGRTDGVGELFRAYKEAVESGAGRPCEFVYVLDGDFPGVLEALVRLREEGERVTAVKLARPFGEATAIAAGFEHASGDIILVLPAWRQVEPEDAAKLLPLLEGHDLVSARRQPRIDPLADRIRSGLHRLVAGPLFDFVVGDPGCGVRAMHRRVLEEIHLYGDHHRFLPLLAHRRGFRVAEADVRQSPGDVPARDGSNTSLLGSLLDILSVFFLVRFTKRPLRFFGALGAAVLGAGVAISAWLFFVKVFHGQSLSNRPLLLLGVMLIVLGVQIVAIGLIGEIIIFTHSREVREYTVEKVVN